MNEEAVDTAVEATGVDVVVVRVAERPQKGIPRLMFDVCLSVLDYLIRPPWKARHKQQTSRDNGGYWPLMIDV